MIACTVKTLIVALVLIPAAVTAQAPTVIVSDHTVTPTILTPGDEGTITVVLTSTASAPSGTALNVQIDSRGLNVTQKTPDNAYIASVLLESKEIEVLSGSYQDIGEIGPGQSIPLTFKIRAPGEEGIYFPEIWVSVRDATGVKYPIPVNVNSGYALIKRPAFRIERDIPESVNPGDTFNLTLTLFNEGQASASDVSISINSSSSMIASKTSENYYVPTVLPGEGTDLLMTFETDIDAPLGLEPISATIEYQSADLTPFKQVATIGIPIVGRAELGVASIRTEPPQINAGDQADLTIRIENTGTADAKSVKATIDNLDISGTKEAFLGTIEPGNDGPAIFTLQTDREGEFHYTLNIWYADDYGTHKTQQPLNMVVARPDMTLVTVTIVAVTIAIIAIAVFWYRKRREE